MIKKIISIFLLLFFVSGITSPALAQAPAQPINNPEESYSKAEVTEILNTDLQNINDVISFKQEINAKILDGPEKGKEVNAINSGSSKFADQKLVNEGDQIVLLKTAQNDKQTYSVWDKYRINYIIFLVIGFFAVVIIFAGLKGFGSILGMITSFVIIIGFIVPQILNGKDPVLITILGSLIILFVTIFLAHGISKKTGIAAFSTFLALIITGVLAYLSIELANLSGLSDENSYLLQIGNFNISAQGLLLGGIIIGSLGVLDDVTTTQSAAIFEIHKLNKKLSISDIFHKGYVIGIDHIASVVNTLVLAYAGASLGLFVIFVINPRNVPTWVILNSEIVMAEVIRAIVGSIGLILAVPITTLVAAIVVKKFNRG